jgi:hypothetical protein
VISRDGLHHSLVQQLLHRAVIAARPAPVAMVDSSRSPPSALVRPGRRKRRRTRHVDRECLVAVNEVELLSSQKSGFQQGGRSRRR